MTIRHLKIFLAVAESGKMSLAAEQLFITQPSVSQAIRELEEHYQTLLFERLSKKLYITEDGKKLYVTAKQLVTQFESLEESMQKENRREKLRIGGTITLGSGILSRVVRDLRAEQPDLEFLYEQYPDHRTKTSEYGAGCGYRGRPCQEPGSGIHSPH
ncbi:LysR family transcriptional regulator [Blautia parvula]|uniref:HTH lysR-type domain-containing protein n=1 Tax=Blautia parvula TaxID=2877527 RepID=A0ABQ0C0W9_9FIRM